MDGGWMSAMTGMFGGDNSDGKKNDGHGSPLMSPVGWGLAERDRRAQERAEQMARSQFRNEQLFNYGNERDAQERTQNLFGQTTGQLGTDYVTGGMLVPTSRAEIGGAALESLLGMASGYNPTMAYNPYLQVLDADKQAVANLRENAQQQTERTLSDWESAMTGLRGEYDVARSTLGAERDRMRDVYTDTLDESRAQDVEQDAKNIVDQWIDSNASAGANGDTRFIATRGVRNRVAGANEGAKRDYVADLVARGLSYEEILTLPEFTGYVAADPSTTTAYSDWLQRNDLSAPDDTAVLRQRQEDYIASLPSYIRRSM